jgi:hypothetical protein
MLRCAVLLVLTFAACTTPPPVRTVPYSEDVLTTARRAISLDALLEHAGAFELIGDRVHAGTTTPFRFCFDTSGRSLFDLSGPAPRAEGCDGLSSWSQDSSGLVRQLGLGTAERVRCEAWLRTGLWLDPWVPRFTSTLDRRQSTPARTALTLARPDTPFRATVWIDTETGLPLEYEIHGERRRVRLEAFARVAGARLPQRYVHVVQGETTIVEEVELTTPVGATFFGPPRPFARDTTFAAHAPSKVDSKLGGDGRLYLRATLDGARVVTLLFDSGFGASAIDRTLASALGWEDLGSAALDGVGSRVESRWRRSGTLSVGPLTVERLEVVELDTQHASKAAGFQVDGVLGADVLARATFELDPASGELLVHDPSDFNGRSDRRELDWRPIALDGTALCIEGRIGDSEPLWFRLDSGSNDTLSVAPWAVAKLELAPTIVDLQSVFLVGPFGHIRGWRGELADVELAGARISRLPATFLDPASGEAGLLDDRWIAGNLGLAALRSHRVFLDLPRRRIALAPTR